MKRITRKELKTDQFALEVGHTVDFFDEHRKELTRYGSIAIAVVVVIIGVVVYQRHQHTAREQALAAAIQVQEAPIGGISASGGLSFPTAEAKDQQTMKVFGELVGKYPGSAEGEVATYYMGAILADQGKLAEAEKRFLEVADKGTGGYPSLAKLSLAQIYFADGRSDQGEKLLRDLMAHPTVFVSKAQATITLARYFSMTKPAEARKLLDPLRSQPGVVGQEALTLYGDLPPQ